MTKVLTVDDIEVEFEKQNPSTSCKWCVYLRVRKDDKEKLLLMFKTDNRPYTKFTIFNDFFAKIEYAKLSNIFDYFSFLSAITDRTIKRMIILS